VAEVLGELAVEQLGGARLSEQLGDGRVRPPAPVADPNCVAAGSRMSTPPARSCRHR
jgi:hypothetical protein